MPGPTESVIIQAQQNFDIDGGINPLKIELEDDKIIDILNSICKKWYVTDIYYMHRVKWHKKIFN